MKKSIFLSVFFIFALAGVAFAQPGNPGCNPDDPNPAVGTWTISASPTNVYGAGPHTITISATYSGECPEPLAPGTITVAYLLKGACITCSGPITATLPTSATTFTVGTFTISGLCNPASSIRFGVTNITGGHSNAGTPHVNVNP